MSEDRHLNAASPIQRGRTIEGLNPQPLRMVFMSANANFEPDRTRFYAPLTLMILSWSMLSLSLGGALGLDSRLHYAVTLGGLLLILGLAMRRPEYRRLKAS